MASGRDGIPPSDGGDYGDEWASDLRMRFERLMRTKRLNDLDLSRSRRGASPALHESASSADPAHRRFPVDPALHLARRRCCHAAVVLVAAKPCP